MNMRPYSLNEFDEQESTNKRELRALTNTMPYIIKEVLTDKQREILHMSLDEQKTQEQIGECLGISQPTVCKHYQAAWRHLREASGIALKAIQEYEKLEEKIT